MEHLRTFLNSSSFMPHGHSYLWQNDILSMNVVSDALVAVAYFAIASELLYLVRKRKDLSFNKIFMMFALFLISCGATHLIDIWTIWIPQYAVQAVAKSLTAGISLMTAGTLWLLMPKALTLPTLSQIRKATEERTQASEVLKASEERYRHLVGAVKDYAIIMLDASGCIVSWNAGAERIKGYKAEEIIGKHFSIFYSTDEIKSRYPERELEQSLAQGRFEDEGWRLRKDGSTFWANVVITPLYDSTGSVYGFSKVTRDITERKHADEALRALNIQLEERVMRRTIELEQANAQLREKQSQLIEAKDEAEAANKAKSAFLANMSHEIRTPLGAILGFSDLIVNNVLSVSEKINYVSAVKRNGELLSNIISDILDLSKVEAGKLNIEQREASLGEVLADIVTLLNLPASEKGIRLSISSEGAVPDKIITDPLRLRQILLNVAGNALKFTEKGSVEICVKSVAEDAGTLKLAFVVTDTGCGLSQSNAAHLFEPFSQADASTTRKYGGTGLGLSLSRKLANLLGGDVKLTETVAGKGSTFTVTINPGRVEKVLFENVNAQNPRLQPPISFAGDIRLDGISVLVVDDASDNQMLVGRYLRIAGAKVETAANGQEALSKVHGAVTFDVVLMDLQMPIMDGYETTATLRKEGYRTPIIAFTAHALKEERDLCLSSGFDAHLSKPINRHALLTSIAGFREKSPATESPS